MGKISNERCHCPLPCLITRGEPQICKLLFVRFSLNLYDQLFSTKIRRCHFCTYLVGSSIHFLKHILIQLPIAKLWAQTIPNSLRQQISLFVQAGLPGPKVRRPVGPSTLTVAQQHFGTNQGLLQWPLNGVFCQQLMEFFVSNRITKIDKIDGSHKEEF